MATKPLVLFLDCRCSEYDLERDAVTRHGGLLELSGSLPGTEEEVLAIERLGLATILLVESARVIVLTAASSAKRWFDTGPATTTWTMPRPRN